MPAIAVVDTVVRNSAFLGLRTLMNEMKHKTPTHTSGTATGAEPLKPTSYMYNRFSINQSHESMLVCQYVLLY